MAELPDLTVFAEILSRRFKGKKLATVEVKVAKKLKGTVSALKTAIESKKLSSVTRYGKTLHLHFEGDQVLQLHLMLRGELVLIDEKHPNPRFEIISFHFTGRTGFAVVDQLKQATPTLNPEPAKAPDALEMELDYFLATLSKTKKMVKEVLMDQKKIRGIGNSYADEILWAARISPSSVANSLPDEVAKKLYKSIKTVLKKAIEEIAAANGDELNGELRDFMKVHGAKIEKSPTGALVKSVKIGGRSSYYTDEQELYQ